MQIRELQEQDYPQLVRLFNAHTRALQPGWGLRTDALRERLTRQTDPDDVASTLVSFEGETLAAAGHVRRWIDDRDGPEAEIVWLLGVPDHGEALRALLGHILDDLSTIPPENVLMGQELYVPVFNGICDAWPHLRAAVSDAGFSPLPQLAEAAYSGPLRQIDTVDAPLPGLVLGRDLGKFGTRFKATMDGTIISQCECCFCFAEFDDVPAMRGWLEMSEIRTLPAWRSKGIGQWVVQSAINWVSAGGYHRAILTVAKDAEERGAGRFYQRFGWAPVGRMEKGWKRWSVTSR